MSSPAGSPLADLSKCLKNWKKNKKQIKKTRTSESYLKKQEGWRGKEKREREKRGLKMRRNQAKITEELKGFAKRMKMMEMQRR